MNHIINRFVNDKKIYLALKYKDKIFWESGYKYKTGKFRITKTFDKKITKDNTVQYEEDIDILKKKILELKEKDYIDDVIYRLKDKKGGYHYYATRGRRFVENGEEYYACVSRNVDVQIEYEKKLSKLAQEYSFTINNLEEGIAWIDENGKIRIINRPFLDFVGYKDDIENNINMDLLFNTLYKNEGITKLKSSIENALKDRKKELIQLRINNIPLSIRINPVIWDDIFKGCIVVLADISNYTDLYSAILRAQKMETIGLLAEGIAHDFNNILAILRTKLDLYGIVKTQTQKDMYVEECLVQLEKAKEIINNITLFSQKLDKEIESVNIKDVLTNVINVSIIGKNVEVETDMEKDLYINANPHLLSQMFMNILRNAINIVEKMPNGKIWINEKKIEENSKYYIKIDIGNNGPPIPEKIRDKLFDPFFTTSDRDKEKGRGLGLAIVANIVKEYNGKISVYSDSYQTVFSILLPYEERVKIEKKQDIYGLFVGDNIFIKNNIVNLTMQLGIHLYMESNWQEIDAIIQKNKIEFVIIDLSMGKNMIKKLNNIYPNIPIIVVTDMSVEYVKEKLESLNIRHILLEPISLEDMEKVINDLK